MYGKHNLCLPKLKKLNKVVCVEIRKTAARTECVSATTSIPRATARIAVSSTSASITIVKEHNIPP